jgi:hypothetical protein
MLGDRTSSSILSMLSRSITQMAQLVLDVLDPARTADLERAAGIEPA